MNLNQPVFQQFVKSKKFCYRFCTESGTGRNLSTVGRNINIMDGSRWVRFSLKS